MADQYKKDLSNWEQKNIFLDDKEFMSIQMRLVPVKVLKGSYQTYCTQIVPSEGQQWLQVILFPGTAFKFSNKLNAQHTAKFILSIMQIKNIPTKIHAISHRINPIYPQAQNDTLQMFQIIVEVQKITDFSIITWSAGCTYLPQIIEKYPWTKNRIQRVFMVSPVVEMSNIQRQKKADFLNQHFFTFVDQVYCQGDQQKIKTLSLTHQLETRKQKSPIVQLPLTFIYGSEQFITKDIEDFIKSVNQYKLNLQKETIQTKIFLDQNHALYSFVTSPQTRSNQESINKLSKTKWLVSKYIADHLEINQKKRIP